MSSASHDPRCQTLRDDALETLPERCQPAFDAHVAECGNCRGWLAMRQAQGRALAALAPVTAPDELEERVRFDLGAEPAPASAGALRSLERLAAPAVLERLVLEELADPALARARRFAGDLSRRPAPLRLESELAARRGTGAASRRRSPVLAMVAAALVFWLAFLAVPEDVQGPERGDRLADLGREYGFQVVQLESPDGLHPMARAFLSGLSGGVEEAR